MDFIKDRGTANATADTVTQKRIYRQNLSTLEYGIIANLVTQQYQQHDEVKFDALLSIPLSERIPGLMASYGKKTMHKLLVMILKAFSNSLVLTKAKKLTDTKISVTACELMLTAYEDKLSLEDIILFLQRAKAGKYGVIKNMAHPSIFFDMLEQYRQARHEAYLKINSAKHEEFKKMGDVARTAPEPTQLNDLLHQAFVIDISNRA
jgi:hypothetical protein